MDRLSLKFPKSAISSAIIGDSQARYLFTHFNPHSCDAPGFVSYGGACFSDVLGLTRHLPSVSRLVLHIGTNDIARNGAARSCKDYLQLLRRLQRELPDLRSIHLSLALPRQPNRRRGSRNGRFVGWFNSEVRNFNREMKRICLNVLKKVYYIDHGFLDLPVSRFLGADGLHPNFEGVALLAQHFKQVLGYGRNQQTSGWLEKTPSATSSLPETSTLSGNVDSTGHIVPTQQNSETAPPTAGASSSNLRSPSPAAAAMGTSPETPVPAPHSTPPASSGTAFPASGSALIHQGSRLSPPELGTTTGLGATPVPARRYQLRRPYADAVRARVPRSEA